MLVRGDQTSCSYLKFGAEARSRAIHARFVEA